jgi:NADPH2:quinone reductase
MRAVAVSRFGEPPKVVDAVTPEAGPGQVLIKLAAASMNPMDVRLASGAWRPGPVTFPMVLGVDGAGVVEAAGEGTTRFFPGERVLGQFLIPPIGAFGTYAEYVAVSAEAPLATVPAGLDLVRAAAAPTAGGAGLSLVEVMEPLEDQLVLIIGAGGGVGSFVTQFAVNSGASVIANINAMADRRMHSYGVTETIIRSKASVAEVVRQSHPDGVDVLIDLVSDARGFAATAALVRPGGSAITTQYVADLEALQCLGIRGVNFDLRMTSELLERVAQGLADGTVVEPPITRVSLDDAPGLCGALKRTPRDGKTVIVL